MSKLGVYEEGEEVDFDQINEQNLKNILLYELVKTSNADIETKSISAERAYETYSNIDRNLRPYRERKDINIVETPKEKFERLQKEFIELKQDIESASQREKSQEKDLLPALLQEIDVLQTELSNISSNKNLKNILDTETAQTLNADQHLIALKKNLDYHKSEALLNRLKSIQKNGGAKDEKNVSYKVDLNTAPENIRQELKFAELQRKITNFEKILGNTESNEVVEGIQRLKNMTELLLEPTLDSVLSRVTHISQQMDRIGSKKQNQNLDDPKLSKIERMHDMYTKVEKTAEQIPQIVNRMEALRIIHEESAKITNKVNRLKENQTAVLRNIEDNSALLKKVEETFSKNIETIGQNVKSLQERITKLGK